MRQERYRFTYSRRSCAREVAGDTSVVFHGWAKIPARLSVELPCVSFGQIDTRNHSCSRWRQRYRPEVELPVYLGICREFGIDSGGA